MAKKQKLKFAPVLFVVYSTNIGCSTLVEPTNKIIRKIYNKLQNTNNGLLFCYRPGCLLVTSPNKRTDKQLDIILQEHTF